MKKIIITILLLFLLTNTLFAATNDDTEYVVIGDAIWIRDQPSTSSKKLEIKNKGDAVNIIDFYDDDWAIIDYDGQEAYIARQYILKQSATEETESNSGIQVDSVKVYKAYVTRSEAQIEEELKENELLESIEARISKENKDKPNEEKPENNDSFFDFIKNFFKIKNEDKTINIVLPETPYYVKKYSNSVEIEQFDYQCEKKNDRYKITIKCLVKKITRGSSSTFTFKLKNNVDFTVISDIDWMNSFQMYDVGEMSENAIIFENVPYSDCYRLIIE